jgi:3-oxoacyl-[acyl-carrier protein] reductase
MNDILLELTKNPAARNVIKTLGLPIPMPEPLVRARGPWSALPFAKNKIVVGGAREPQLIDAIAQTLAEAGASTYFDGDAGIAAAFVETSEAYARPARPDALLDGDAPVHALVFDATSVKSVDGLRALYDFFHPRIGRLERSGRVVVLGRIGEASSAEEEAVQGALSGFVRSTAKEIGRKGGTANTILVERGAESRVGAVLRWVLGPCAAFVSAQPLVVSSRAKDAPKRNGKGVPFVQPLDGKVAIVTGAARGIGRATATVLAAEGAHVFVADRPEDGDETSRVARSIGGTPLLVDVTADDAAARITEAVGPKGVDILVHNAGVTRDKTLARMKPEHWDAVLAVSLGAAVRITGALEKNVLRDGGRVICLSSIAGIAGNVGQTNYGAAKAGLIGYVDALSKRLASRGITVNAIAPGFIETRMTAAIPVMIREAGRRLSALGQGGLPEDVAQAIMFLASPGAQGISGRTLRVCGGALIGA